jgi:hypothetical protein
MSHQELPAFYDSSKTKDEKGFARQREYAIN